ncbi:MAG: polynucleotide adenylyltransferase PcnB [Planctomycetota bacterium]
MPRSSNHPGDDELEEDEFDVLDADDELDDDDDELDDDDDDDELDDDDDELDDDPATAHAGLAVDEGEFDETIPLALIDQDALRVLSRLQRNGHEAYLVGGCVRDLLLGRKPKDFDIATSAHPRQIKRLFRNGRIIGRRFRLVHIVYGQHVIETSTFRSEPSPTTGDSDLLIVEDNEYGTAEQDARRRDFTVNGLFYDPNSETILDHVGGLADLEAGVLRTIGDPEVRFAEDPVRILRAIKFATRLGFRIEDATWDAMQTHVDELVRSATPRVAEEILRLLRSGTALGAFRMMRKSGALRVLLPSIDEFLVAGNHAPEKTESFWRLLEAVDAEVHAGDPPSNDVLVAALFLRAIEWQVDQLGARHGAARADLSSVASEMMESFTNPARLPRRLAERARRIIANQVRFTQPQSKRFRPVLFMHGDDFVDSLRLFKLRSAAWGQGWDVYEGWVERYRKALALGNAELEEIRADNRRGRRRRRRRRRGSDDDGD